MADPSGKVVIISGPSGAGKSTVVEYLLRSCSLPLRLSISATTRPPRSGEVDGQDYFFLDADRFSELRQNDKLLECKEVFRQGHWYGTLREQVTTGLEAGNWVILEIDVEGALAVRQQLPEAVMIFLHAGSRAELENRLRTRGTDSEESIQRRLATASRELGASHQYDYTVENRQPEQAAEQICEFLKAME